MKKAYSLLLAVIIMCLFMACGKDAKYIVCESCGEESASDAAFCSKCGLSLNNASSTTAPDATKQEDVLQYPAENDEWKYDVYTNHVVLTKYKGFEEIVQIPETLEGLPVTELKASNISGEDDCFSRNETIKKVILTENIKRIGGFEYSSIENVVFANDAYIEFDSHTFKGCDRIKNINTIIAHMSGADCFPRIFAESESDALNSIVIPDRFDFIDSFAFHGCKAMQHIDVGNASGIGQCAFKGTSLKTLTIHNKSCEIDNNLLGDYGEFGDLIIAAPAGSMAAQFASRFSLEFERIEE